MFLAQGAASAKARQAHRQGGAHRWSAGGLEEVPAVGEGPGKVGWTRSGPSGETWTPPQSQKFIIREIPEETQTLLRENYRKDVRDLSEVSEGLEA